MAQFFEPLARSPTWQVRLLYVAFTIHRGEGRRGLEGRWWKEHRSIYEADRGGEVHERAIKRLRIGGEKGISWFGDNEIAFLSRGYERNDRSLKG